MPGTPNPMTTPPSPTLSPGDDTLPDLREATPVWVKIGLMSFGGPAGQIALMQDEVVTRHGWVPPESFDRGLSFAMLLPGPEAQQLATWLGWRLHGLAGGLVAGLAFIVPGALLMMALAWIAAAHGSVPIIAAIFGGVQPVVIALVIAAMQKIAGRALKHPLHWAIAIAAFAALYWLKLPFPLVVAAAAGIGFALPFSEETTTADHPQTGGILRHALVVIGISTAIGVAIYLTNRGLTGSSPHDGVAALFTTAALVTFGGAYAVLPYVASQSVEAYQWLSPEQMLNGLAIAEATPGPLILVNTYAGFFAGWSDAATFGAGAHTAILATFFTFLPSFALILAFAPAVERIQNVPWARRALAGVSAAVVGVIANLVLFLAEAAFLPNGLSEPHWVKIALFVVSLGLVFWLKAGMLKLVGFGVLAGIALHFAGLL
jgi:chromate transporter